MTIINILMTRDSMTREEAQARWEELRDEAWEITSNNTLDPFTKHELLSELIAYEVGLEPDYLFEFMP